MEAPQTRRWRVLTRLLAVMLPAALCNAVPAAADTGCPSPIAGLGSGQVYYVSPTGNDANSGLSPCAPWQTMAKVDGVDFKPGDTVAFQGGQTFSVSLSPWGGLTGSASQPIFYTSYGSGQASLTGGVYLNSVSYLTLDHLTIANAAGAGVGSGGSGTGAKHIVVRNSVITSSYNGGIGGYGVGLRNALDSDWTIANDNISNTADSGVFYIGSSVAILGTTFRNNGIGSYCGTGAGQNPCHAIYAKGPGATVIGNTITNPQAVGVSLRDPGNTVQGNTIVGGQKAIAFSSETTTPGTTYIVGNTVSGQQDTGIQLYSGTQPLYESFVVASNTVYNPVNYGIYIVSGPNSGSTQTVTMANNLVQTGSGAHGYLNLAYPFSYTKSTYNEHYDSFYGAGNSSPYYVNGTARTWNVYTNWLGSGSEGRNDLTTANPLLNTTTFALGSGSPAIGAGTSSVPAISYSNTTSCPGGSTTPLQWQYCGSSSTPNMGSN